jgi:hypothetical protein
VPVLTGWPSTAVTGMMPPAVEVMSTSAAPAQVTGGQRAFFDWLACLAGQLDHRAPGG